jgi:RNA polymerase sigma factor (TIGR02999 family)
MEDGSSSHDSSHEVTRLLRAVQSGQDAAENELYERVHTELRDRARRQRRRWKGDPSLRTTALAHEAYLKLVAQKEQSWESRSHFFAVAAKAMRHILIDAARRKTRAKRGGHVPTLSLEGLRKRIDRHVAVVEEAAEVIMLLDEALERLEEKHPRAARGVECRFFAGMTIEETAEALGVSERTVSRDWTHAQLWLLREMKRIQRGGVRPDEGDAVPEGDTPLETDES